MIALLLVLSSCLVRTDSGSTSQPIVGEEHRCTIERYCGAVGLEALQPRSLCADNQDELENRVAFECWGDAGMCSGGFCHAICNGTGVPCLFVPEGP